MSSKIESLKTALDVSVDAVCNSCAMFSKHPGIDFTRSRKLSLRTLLSFVLAMEGGTLNKEILRYFGCSSEIPSPAAFVQQRSKINSEAFPALFDFFVQNTDTNLTHNGLRLIAVDGSDFVIPANPDHTDSYFTGTELQKPYNLLHMDAMYDLLQHTYLDVALLGKRKANESASLCTLVDRSSVEKALVIADRGYEGYNATAHIQEKGWFFLIWIQDIQNSNGIAAGLELPHTDTFDCFVDLNLTTNQYKLMTSVFDYLPQENRKYDPTVFYRLPFRVIFLLLLR